jgi:hypothetical protein
MMGGFDRVSCLLGRCFAFLQGCRILLDIIVILHKLAFCLEGERACVTQGLIR